MTKKRTKIAKEKSSEQKTKGLVTPKITAVFIVEGCSQETIEALRGALHVLGQVLRANHVEVEWEGE